MQKSLYFDGQDVLSTDLTNAETTKEAELLRRLIDVTSTQGVVTGLVVSNGSAGSLTISSGRAYAANGEVINVPANQVDTIVLGAAGVDNGKWVVAQHVDVDGSLAAHPVTGVLNDTRRTDSFSFAMTSSPGANQVKLALIVSTAGAPAIATLDATVPTNRTTLGARVSFDSVTDAMMRQDGPAPGVTDISKIWRHVYDGFGTGTVTLTNVHGLSPDDIGSVDPTPEHQEFFHKTGIAGKSAANAWEVAVDSAPLPDRLTVTAPLATDRAIVNGATVKDTPAPSPNPILFGAETANFTLFEIYLDSTNALLKSQRVQWSVPIGSVNVKGVYLVDVSEGHPTGAHNFDFNFVNKTLAWSGGTPVDLMASTEPDGFIRIYDADEVQFIDVYVDVSEVYALLANKTDTVTVNATVNRDTFLLLATVPWSGLADGELGYGSWQTSGLAYDKRTYGNLAEGQLHETLKGLLQKIHRQGAGNGVFRGLEVTKDGGPPSLDIEWSGGEAWVDGRHYDIVGGTLVVGATNPQYVYVDSTGTVVSNNTDPATVYPEIEFALLSRHTTNGVDDITATQDERVLLSQMQGLGEKLLRTAAAALVPRTKNRISIAATVTYTLMSEYRHPTGAQPPFRTYVSTSGNMTMTKNARWDGTNWNADIAAQPSGFYSFGSSVTVRRKHAGAAAWVDTAWEADNLDSELPRLRLPHVRTANTHYTLLMESKPEASGISSHRLYAFSSTVGTPELVMTMNAKWVAASQMWAADDIAASAGRFNLNFAGVTILRRDTTAAPWADSGWGGSQFILPAITGSGIRGLFEGVDAAFKVDSPTTGTGGSNPPAGTGVSNELRAKNIPKAWASFSIVGGVPTVNDGFNVTAALNGLTLLRISFPASFGNSSYAMVCHLNLFDLSSNQPYEFQVPILGQTSSHIDIGITNSAGTYQDLTAHIIQGWLAFFGVQ